MKKIYLVLNLHDKVAGNTKLAILIWIPLFLKGYTVAALVNVLICGEENYGDFYNC
jgi:hypothetical protein